MKKVSVRLAKRPAPEPNAGAVPAEAREGARENVREGAREVVHENVRENIREGARGKRP